MPAARTTLVALLLGACTSASAPVVEEPPPAEPVQVEPPAPAAPPVSELKFSEHTPPVVAPPPSIFAAKSFPKNVYAAIVGGWEADKRSWSVDIVDTQIVEGSELDQAIEALAAAQQAGTSGGEEESYFEHAELPAGHVAIPKGWKVGDTWTLLTRAGTVTRKVKAFAITIPGGSGTYHFEVDLGSAPKSTKGPAIAVRGAGMAPTIAKPEALPLAMLGEGALAKVRAGLPKKGEPEQLATAREHPPSEKHIAVYAGRFPGGRTHAIFVNIASEDFTPFGALLFAHQDGTIAGYSLSSAQGEMSAWAIVDLDGDGFDEIVYEDQYHEGWYLDLVYWQGERPKTRTLTGDGL